MPHLPGAGHAAGGDRRPGAPPPEFFAGDPRIAGVTGDIARPGFAEQVLDTAVGRFGQADVLVNDAAAYPDGTLLDMPAAAWDRVFAVNVTGTFMLTQAFARHCAGRGAAVVSISTGSARSPRPGGAAYAASKAAVETMGKVFAMELGPLGIGVNVVAPGYIDVRGWSDAYPDRAPEDLRTALVRSIPLGRAGDPRDIASAVLFLASADASHIRLTTKRKAAKPVLGGELPNAIDRPPGCHFHPRCPMVMPRCREEEPLPIRLPGGRMVACHLTASPRRRRAGP